MEWYPWIKSLHVVADMAWMAGMLYLPRLFVYHASAKPGSNLSETFKIMERRLLKAIMTPALVVAWMTGLFLVWKAGFHQAGWLQLKVLLVMAMSALHEYFSVLVNAFANDKNRKGPKFYRILNEMPTLLLILIVILVIVKPF